MMYEEVDSKPIFFSYTGVKTEEEARMEKESIITNKDKYVNALPLGMLIHVERIESVFPGR